MQCYYGVFLAAHDALHQYETVCYVRACVRACIRLFAQFVVARQHITMGHDNRTWTTCTTIARLIFSVSLSLIWCFDIMMNAIGNNNSECSLWIVVVVIASCLHFSFYLSFSLSNTKCFRMLNDDLSLIQSRHSRNSIKIMIVNVDILYLPNNGPKFHLNANNNFPTICRAYMLLSCCEPRN